MSLCPCGSRRDYDECCGPLLAGAPAPTAEALMRSRYTAFTEGKVDYLKDTLTPEEQADFDPEETRIMATEAKWQGLEIRAAGGGRRRRPGIGGIRRPLQAARPDPHAPRAGELPARRRRLALRRRGGLTPRRRRARPPRSAATIPAPADRARNTRSAAAPERRADPVPVSAAGQANSLTSSSAPR